MRKNCLGIMVGTLLLVVAGANAQTNTFPTSGNVGIGTTNPEAPLTVSRYFYPGLGSNRFVTAVFWTGADVNLLVGGDLNGTSTPYLQSKAGGSSDSIGHGSYNLALNPYGGNVGIGVLNPQATLDVDGNFMLTRGSGGSITFADGTVQSTAYTGVACGGDYAEQVNVAGDRRRFVPGDVLVIDPDHPGKFLKSDTPYATSVAGVYSTKPGFVGHAVGMPKTPNQVPMAMLGIVPTKVSAINGAIHPGDLLFTSSILGTAMKGTDRSRLTGAIVGKALGNLNSGTGVIEVLVTLQ